MSFALIIYLISVLSGLKAVFIGIAMVLSAFALGYFIYIGSEGEENKHGTKIVVAILLSSFLATITPSERTAYVMVGGYVAQQMVQSETSDKVVQIINNKLDEIISEDAEKTKK